MARRALAAPQTTETGESARLLLLASVAITVLLDVMPFGHTIGYPLYLLSTVVHEMGHGVAGSLVGCHWTSLEIFSGAGGLAHVSGCPSDAARGFTSAGGLCGPAVLAGLLYFLGTRPRVAVVALGSLGAILLVVALVYVRSFFGLPFVAAFGLAILVIARKASAATSQLVLLLLAVQLSLSVFSRADYLFTEVAKFPTASYPSDVANMSAVLSGPYWLWGALCGGFSVVTLGAGLWVFSRATRSRAARLAG